MFRASAPAKSKILGWNDFVPGDTQMPNFATKVAYYDIPLGYGSVLEASKPLRMYIKAKYEEVVVPSVAPNVAINLAAAGHTALQSTRAAAAFPTMAHPDLVAFESSNNGLTWTKTTIVNMNWLSGVITIAKTATTNRVKVYFLPGTGEIQLFGFRPVGSDIAGGKIFGKPFRDLHETDQTNDRSAMQLTSGRDVALISQFRLAIEVRSPSLVEWSKDAEHDLLIPTKFAPIQIDDIQGANVEIERGLRGGNF